MGLSINSPPNSNFGLDCWVTGAPVAVDNAPTTFASVADKRKSRLVQKNGAVLVSGTATLRVISVGGTSITYTPFYWDNILSAWVPVGAVAASLSSGGAPAIFNGLVFAGAYFYVQIVSQTGGVTAVGYHVG